jgi:hypothetical protein
VVEAPSWQEALIAAAPATPPVRSATADPAVEHLSAAAALAGAAAQLRRVAAGTAAAESGVAADGSRWWSDSGVEEQAGGRLCRWTLVRRVSADGSSETEDKWWETSDRFSYRELGAQKSGRNSAGDVWRESWSESYAPDAVSGLGEIKRSADKWATDGSGANWHERWSEAFRADGAVDRSADKFGRLAEGVIPEDGHAGEWRERWGESWDGKGGASKWSDRWAERKEREGGGQGRRWGEKTEQRFESGAGGRWGEAWSDDPQGDGWYSRKWAEDHLGGGAVRKWGESTTGEHWENTVEEDTWYEGVPNFGWAEALRHSPQLLAVPLRPGEGEAADGESEAGVMKRAKRRGGGAAAPDAPQA